LGLLNRSGIALALSILVVVSCSSPENSLAPSSTFSPTGKFEEPIVAAVETKVGTSMDALTGRFETLQAKSVVSCLSEHGYRVSIDDAKKFLGQSNFNQPSEYEIAETYFREGRMIGGVPEGISEDSYGNCTMVANNMKSPALSLRELMERATREVSNRVTINNEFLRAKAAEANCLQSIGENPADSMTPPDLQISDLVGRVMNGVLSPSEALKQLALLKSTVAQFDARTKARKACENPMISTERALVSQEQARFLQNNPGWVEGIADKFRVQIKLMFESE
jgi:hypothetical protein